MDIKEEIKELKDKIIELETEIKNERNWKPRYNEEYWIVDLDTMATDRLRWDNDEYDKLRYGNGVIFGTEEKAREYLEYLEEKKEYMNTFTEKEWEDSTIKKWYYMYDYAIKKFFIDYQQIHRENIPYFEEKEEVEDFINKYEWQIKHELGVE